MEQALKADIIPLTPIDLSIAAMLIIGLALLSLKLNLGIAGRLLISGMRTVVQLLLIGLVLKILFGPIHPVWLGLMALVMLTAASKEVLARQKRKFSGYWGFGIGAVSMFISSFSITLIALVVIINPNPWYAPQYAIPLLGMMLGNTMSGISIGLERLTSMTWDWRDIIEGRLMLGETWSAAIGDIRKDSIRSALIPIINSMAAAGLVSLPGMMTGQILAGNSPVDAVKYQILIMFLIAGGTGFGAVAAVYFGSRRLFDKRHRLRLGRLKRAVD